MARLDIWAIDKLIADLAAKRIEGKYVQTPDSSYLVPKEREDGSYYLPAPSDLPSYLEADTQLLSENLQDWEFEDPRKFTLQYAQEKLLDRHLDFKGLERIKSARRVVNRAEKSLEAYIEEERQLLERTLANIPANSEAEDSIKNAITQLSAKPDHIPRGFGDELKLFLNEATLKQFEIVQTQLHQKLEMMDPTTGTVTSRELDQILVDDLTRDKQSILETAMRNARLERYRIESLLERHASLNRPYLAEEALVLHHYLPEDAADRAMAIREQIFGQLEEQQLLETVKRRAKNDIVELQNLLNILDRLDRDPGRGNQDPSARQPTHDA